MSTAEVDGSSPAINAARSTEYQLPSDALAGALHRLLGDDRLRATLGKAAKRRAELEFSAERMVNRTLQVYEEVMGGRG